MEERDTGVLALITQTTHPHPLAVVVIEAITEGYSRWLGELTGLHLQVRISDGDEDCSDK